MKRGTTLILKVAVLLIGTPVFAAVLQELLKDAIDIKNDNDLMI